MFRLKLMPWEYGIRNLFRRPVRTLLTFSGLTIVLLLVFVVLGFIRGLDHSLTVTGDPKTAIVFSLGMGRNLEYSSIAMKAGDIVPASVEGIQERYGRKYVSPELYLGTEVAVGERAPSFGLVRGVTQSALLVRKQVELRDGNWPKKGEVLVGEMVATKLGVPRAKLTVGQTIRFEGRQWRIAGSFLAVGSAFESEVWCHLDDLQQAMKRQDLSLIALTLSNQGEFAELDAFCKERLDLELQAMQETDYYKSLQKHYDPIRMLAWLVVILVAGAGIFAGLNTMYGAAVGRIRELATLQTIGFRRTALLFSLMQESLLLSAGATMAATALSLILLQGAAIRFTMGAFALQIDNTAILIGCAIGLALGIIGSIPPAIRAMQVPVVDGLKSV